jgi:hypothetical protein
MPEPAEILEGLGAIANREAHFAIAWHVVLLGVLAAVLAGWRPSARAAGAALSLPLLSVSLFAWAYGNPFNGTVFLGLAAALGLLALRLPMRPGAAALAVQSWLRRA